MLWHKYENFDKKPKAEIPIAYNIFGITLALFLNLLVLRSISSWIQNLQLEIVDFEN